MSIKVEYILIAAVLIFVCVFAYMSVVTDFEFGGSDDKGKDLISEIDPDYEPVAEPFWEPPSGEVESLLFCLQGVFGSLVMGWFFGYYYASYKFKKDAAKKV